MATGGPVGLSAVTGSDGHLLIACASAQRIVEYGTGAAATCDDIRAMYRKKYSFVHPVHAVRLPPPERTTAVLDVDRDGRRRICLVDADGRVLQSIGGSADDPVLTDLLSTTTRLVVRPTWPPRLLVVDGARNLLVEIDTLMAVPSREVVVDGDSSMPPTTAAETELSRRPPATLISLVSGRSTAGDDGSDQQPPLRLGGPNCALFDETTRRLYVAETGTCCAGTGCCSCGCCCWRIMAFAVGDALSPA